MYRDEGRLVVSPSDLVGYLLCGHLTELSLEVADGRLDRPPGDGELSVVQARGLEHERAYLEGLKAQGRAVTVVSEEGGPRARATRTEAAFADGPDVIYQAAFFDQRGSGPAWVGYADFLAKVDKPSLLGSYSYEPEDTKLARHVHPSAVLQLCEYAEQLERLQGTAPHHIHVVLGGQSRVTLRLADFAAYFRVAKARFMEACSVGVTSYPLPVAHCAVCRWASNCESRWTADDHLTLVAGLRSDQAERLRSGAGVGTVADLAVYQGGPVKGIGSAVLDKLRQQARLQVAAREFPDRAPPYELLEGSGPGIGLAALPEPSPGDLFFDIEGDPFVGESGLEYLLGVGWLDPEGEFDFTAFWGTDGEGEKAAFEAFIDFVTARRAVYPDLHIFHYASYERTALGKLMGRYGTREDEVDDLFRSGVLIDLYRVVTQSMRVGTPSYSLKKLEALYMEARTQAIIDAGSSIDQFEEWLESGDPSILAEIEEYNRVDCQSTQLLRDWLEDRRSEYADDFGTLPVRPAQHAGTTETPASGAVDDEVRRSLLSAGGPSANPEEAAACSLLADLLDWHRREDKPVWWEYFHRVYDCVEDDLFEDTEAISGLDYVGEARREKRSTVHRYRFDPGQEFKLRAGDVVADPDSVRRQAEGQPKVPGPGKLVSIDSDAGLLELKRATTSRAPHPRSLIPAGPINSSSQQDALRRIATSVTASGIDGSGPYRAVRDLLLRYPPRTNPVTVDGALVRPEESAEDAVTRIAAHLDEGYLAVQGPPGSGKTRAAARLALALIEKGVQVGITANSHSVITNLIDEIGRQAVKSGVSFRASQKGEPHQVSVHPAVTRRNENSEIADDLADGVDIVAGTAWLFSRPEFDQALGCLIVDEAGQFSLANTVAIGAAARNLVLVGDPLQLAQPSKGTHPGEAGVSALEHVLGGAETLPRDLGVFLDQTYRMHPAICSFISEVVYDDRLHPVPGLERQSVSGDDALSGSGLRWRPVNHAGNRTASPEEAEEVASCVDQLLGRTFTDAKGDEAADRAR